MTLKPKGILVISPPRLLAFLHLSMLFEIRCPCLELTCFLSLGADPLFFEGKCMYAQTKGGLLEVYTADATLITGWTGYGWSTLWVVRFHQHVDFRAAERQTSWG